MWWQERNSDVRMLIDETRAIVDFVVDDEEEIFLGGVLGDVRVGVFLVGHCGCDVMWCGCLVVVECWLFRNDFEPRRGVVVVFCGGERFGGEEHRRERDVVDVGERTDQM